METVLVTSRVREYPRNGESMVGERLSLFSMLYSSAVIVNGFPAPDAVRCSDCIARFSILWMIL